MVKAFGTFKNVIMRPLGISLVLLFILSLTSCEQKPESVEALGAGMSEEFIASTDEQETNESLERKLIKEGQIEFETENLNATRKNVFNAVDKYKSYVSSDKEFKSPGRSSITVVIRVPAANFDNLLNDATHGIDKFDRKEINVKDVTEKFLDFEARLKTKKELEIRYLDLLKQATNVIEILEIEKQAGKLRSEIESIEGRLNYLQSQVSFSTLTMTFYESIPKQTEFGQKFKNGLSNGWDNLIWFFVMLTNIWPFILITVGIIGFKIYRKKK